MFVAVRSSLAVLLTVASGGLLVAACSDDTTLDSPPASAGGSSASGSGGSSQSTGGVAGHTAGGASGAAGASAGQAGGSGSGALGGHGGAAAGGASGAGGAKGGSGGSGGSTAGSAGVGGSTGGAAGATAGGSGAGGGAGSSGVGGSSGAAGSGGVMDGTYDSVDHVRRDDVTNKYCPPSGGAAGAGGSSAAGAGGSSTAGAGAGGSSAGGDAGAAGSGGASAGASGAAGASGNAANLAILNSIFDTGPVCPAVPDPASSGFVPFTVNAPDGTAIAASWKPSQIQPPRGTIIFSYGSDESQALVEQADDVTLSVFDALRFNVVVWDYEGYGLSKGSNDLTNLVPNLRAVTDAVHARTDPGADKVVLMGFSLGSVVALGVAAQSPPGLQALVLVEACDISIPFYADPSTGLLAMAGATLAGWPADMFSETSAASVTVPLLIEHNMRDPICPIDGANAILAKVPGTDKQLVTLSQPQEPDGSYELHIEFEENEAAYADPLAAFLKAHLN